jgi:hypothetical protein
LRIFLTSSHSENKYAKPTRPRDTFFVIGVLAGTVKSNLEIPPAISRFLSLYFVQMALGTEGGLCAAFAFMVSPPMWESALQQRI